MAMDRNLSGDTCARCKSRNGTDNAEGDRCSRDAHRAELCDQEAKCHLYALAIHEEGNDSEKWHGLLQLVGGCAPKPLLFPYMNPWKSSANGSPAPGSVCLENSDLQARLGPKAGHSARLFGASGPEYSRTEPVPIGFEFGPRFGSCAEPDHKFSSGFGDGTKCTTSATPLPPFPPSLVAVANVVTATFVVAVVVPSAKPFAVVALQVARRTPHCGCVVVVVGLWVHKTCIGLLAAVVAMARVEVHLRQRGRWWQQR
ncbi:hypothetical protein EDB85DRAFT_1894851 [Lactarius pseudohatsudake]|nr:hypothetical protein EDB85DRAFT_1894851 [Lactarius pseudohatsudake]